jgi:hypothetical protein
MPIWLQFVNRAVRIAKWLALGQLDCRQKKGDLAAALTLAID